MVAQIPIQVRVILDKPGIVDKTRPVAKLPCEARVSRQKPLISPFAESISPSMSDRPISRRSYTRIAEPQGCSQRMPSGLAHHPLPEGLG